MRSYVVLTALAAALAMSMSSSRAFAQHEHEGEHEEWPADAALPLCPVMEKPVDFSASVPTDQGPVFFCCKRCAEKYQADPDKYAEKVGAQRKALADRPKVQLVCPVSGRPVDQDVFIEDDGQKVYFCCPKCPEQYKAEPAKYAAALANSYGYQTRCPVMGKEINPQAFLELADGRKVYFCCKPCEKKLLKDPAKYVPSLKKQGLVIDVEDITKPKKAGQG